MSLICYIKGHDIEKSYYRAPVYEFWVFDKKANKYLQKDMNADLNQNEFWCHRCSRYIKYNDLP